MKLFLINTFVNPKHRNEWSYHFLATQVELISHTQRHIHTHIGTEKFKYQNLNETMCI